VGALGIGGLRSARRDVNRGIHIPSHSFALQPLDTRPGRDHLSAEVFEGASNVPGGHDKGGEPVRTFVVVLIGLVVVLAVLIEVCLLQAASMRRKVKAVLPPPEDGEEEDR
jgi:hypothetical protein